MNMFLGKMLLFIGGQLWEMGGYWQAGDMYKNLTWYGKIGYKIFCKGLELTGRRPEDFNRF